MVCDAADISMVQTHQLFNYSPSCKVAARGYFLTMGDPRDTKTHAKKKKRKAGWHTWGKRVLPKTGAWLAGTTPQLLARL